MKILLAVDGSVYSDAAIEEIVKRPWLPKSEVKVITTVMPIILGVGPWAGSPDSFKHMEKDSRRCNRSNQPGRVEARNY